MSKTTRLRLDLISQHQIAKEITVNNSFSRIDESVLLYVMSISNNPPDTNNNMGLFVIGRSPTGSWSGKAHNFARLHGDVWEMWPIQVNAAFFALHDKKIYYMTTNGPVAAW